MVYYDPRKPKPWPIRLLNKWGIINDSLATTIILTAAAAGILISIVLYNNLIFNTTSNSEVDTLIEAEFSAIQ